MINNVVQGNLITMGLNGDFNVIVHGCNCFNTMGSGIAWELKNRCPKAYKVDCNTVRGDKSKLGTFTSALVGNRLVVINAYTQYDYHRVPGRVNADYGAIKSVFETLNFMYGGSGHKIGIPLIGAGLAGGDWEVIKEIINKATPNLEITLVEFDGSK